MISFLIKSSSDLQRIRTAIKSWTSLILVQITDYSHGSYCRLVSVRHIMGENIEASSNLQMMGTDIILDKFNFSVVWTVVW